MLLSQKFINPAGFMNLNFILCLLHIDAEMAELIWNRLCVEYNIGFFHHHHHFIYKVNNECVHQV